ncbi:DNA excision repair protein ERCC-1 [Polypterus senegalus]|uniref:DNA excision repair protein ERCC-1 n=1 Tax=Polypterus senegalus TaxID=55291 RepID=UPI0019667E42|nr:DNA excision repair protein ERCC-1 [Polypterus senegalus]
MEKKRFNINLEDSIFNKEPTTVKPLFKFSVDSDAKATQPKPDSDSRPLSYSEFIIKQKASSSSGKTDWVSPKKEAKSRDANHPVCASKSEPEEETKCPKNDVSAGIEKPAGALLENQGSNWDEEQLVGNLQTGNADTENEGVPSAVCAPKPPGSGNSIIVSLRQRGNPILKFVRNVPWEFGDIIPDYVLGQTTCALFLSLRYHNLNPNYIHDRLKQLGKAFTLRVLLVQVDVKDPHHCLKELARICLLADCTLILAWSPEEAGRYLETYKSYEKKPADLLMERVEQDFLSKVTDCLTTVKSVNKTDTVTLLSTFSSLKRIMTASKEELTLCPGLGPQKARRLHDVFNQPFLKSRKQKTEEKTQA